VALAFLIWRMSIESLLLVEGLKVCRNTNFDLRLMGPRDTYELPFADRLRWTYYSFFGIWRQLLYWSTRSKIRVRFFSTHGEGNFLWKSEELEECPTTASDRAPPFRFGILYPDMRGVSEAAMINCNERNRSGDSPLDEERLWTDSVWAWTSREYDLRDCLFEIRFPKRRSMSNTFWHISV
jgi:hypothetical protein